MATLELGWEPVTSSDHTHLGGHNSGHLSPLSPLWDTCAQRGINKGLAVGMSSPRFTRVRGPQPANCKAPRADT